jgi:HAD superfamily hydrolase (TIGR01509 family)
MKYMFKAIFFDRDGTLTYNNPEKETWRDKTVENWSGKPFELSYEKMMGLFKKASEGKSPWYKNVDDEKEFFKRYYKHLLLEENVKEELETRSKLLFEELWCNNDKIPYPETIDVLEYFRNNGYKMGVISDTSPSLEYTLQQLGLAKYFTSFTASSLVGAGKPSPIIFNAALAAQNVTASESLYVDDYDVEADGARKLGFTSFLIDRSGQKKDLWTINNLKEIIKYVEEIS